MLHNELKEAARLVGGLRIEPAVIHLLDHTSSHILTHNTATAGVAALSTFCLDPKPVDDRRYILSVNLCGRQ